MLCLKFLMIGSPIHLITRLLDYCLIGFLYVYIVKWNTVFKSPLKMISNVHNRRKILDLHHLTFTNMIIAMLKPWFCGGPSVTMCTSHRRVSRHDKVWVFKDVFIKWCISMLLFIGVFFHLWIYIVVCCTFRVINHFRVRVQLNMMTYTDNINDFNHQVPMEASLRKWYELSLMNLPSNL